MALKFLKEKGPFYFIPDWDDLVDPNYDFITDTPHSKGWENTVYAHELIVPPPYDGLLVSKVVEEKSKMRKERIRSMGIHKALRVEDTFPVMGDCGAFGYIEEDVPPYGTDEILDYYTRGGFNLGVSIDHLIPSPEHPDREFRYKITLKNSKKFLQEHKKRNLHWEPVGAVQGWNVETYAEAAYKTAKTGYKTIALGGLVRSSTKDIVAILQEVKKQIPSSVRVHLFGVSRTALLEELPKYNVFSIDSASSLRRAWMGAKDNYHLLHKEYCAIRVPEPGKRGPMKSLMGSELEKAKILEKKSLNELRAYDKGDIDLKDLLKTLKEYEKYYIGKNKSRLDSYETTLRDKPWQKCACPICKSVGVEVIIFRGNNRNRRRGFHNTWILKQKIDKLRK